MAENTMPQDAVAQEARIKELTEENEALFEQLHVVQEELEKYYYKLKDCEQKNGQSASGTTSVFCQSPDVLAENLKLKALVEQQKIALRVETQNSPAARLGDMLIKGVASTGSLLALPGRLRRMWKAMDRKTPPSILGGKTFQKVIDAYTDGGDQAVEKLLDSVFLAPSMRANAHTALARHLMTVDTDQAAAHARLAWETDPRPYRLKWLAFRLHDAGDPVRAEALLEMLPADISMSESEERQTGRIRQESKQKRMEAARRESGAADAERMYKELARQAAEGKKEVEHLKAQLDKAQKAAELYKKEQVRQAAEDKKEVEHLKAQFEESKKKVEHLKAQLDKAQKTAELYKKDADALAVQTAKMLKSMLTQFESDTGVLSKVIRVVMGASAHETAGETRR